MIHYLLWGTEQSVDRRCGGPSAGAGPWESEAEGGKRVGGKSIPVGNFQHWLPRDEQKSSEHKQRHGHIRGIGKLWLSDQT